MIQNPGTHHTQLLVARNAKTYPFVYRRMPSMPTYQTHHEQPRNPPNPNRIPTEPWTHVSSDLITGLPESEGFNAILVVVDRFSKMIVLIPTRDTITAPQMADNFRDHIWKCFGMPEQIISD